METIKIDSLINTKDIFSLKKYCSNLMGFMVVCLSHYFLTDSAPFHFELAEALEDEENDLLEIIGFRGSAKTTFASLGFPLQCALSGKYKFIVIINDTGEQVRGNLNNIKTEFESNPFLKILYPNVKMGYTWSSFNLLLSNGVRIIGRSRGQNIRGIRHKQHRPDLIIVDDPENTLQVKKKESRDATESWFNSEVVPAQQETGAKLIVIGNLLHKDGFMARLAKNDLFKVIRIPFYEEGTGKVAWKGKYPTPEIIAKQRKKVGETAWSREYLLKIVNPENQVINETDITKYPNEILTKLNRDGELDIKILDGGVGIDLAISEKQTADFTAMIPAIRVKWNDKIYILIKPNGIKKRMDFDATLKAAKLLNDSMPIGTKNYVEDVGYQRVALQQMKKKGLSVYPMRPITDKRARLETVAPFIKDGTVLFPETGCEDLIQSLINFGIEAHDDDVDALVYVILGMTKRSGVAFSVDKIDKL